MTKPTPQGRAKGFEFKQFFVAHDRCAMKVGTDSIMLGSWTEPGQARRILDIGTGSGLLALMMAQTSSADSRICGVDRDPQAIVQARENAVNSPWADKLVFECLPLQAMPKRPGYDLIISNPPYFPHQHSLEPARQAARLTAELSHQELVQAVSGLLTEQGRFCCVLPQQLVEGLVTMAREEGLYVSRRMEVRSQPDKSVSRVLLEFSRTAPHQVNTQNLIIQQQAGHYTQAYRKLCQHFYLNF
ncbi:tRNA1(Val) (adenine(37)-N6)-methyltransferase [Lacimicrobium alkaliphilum]|uniref:tRNA1(Val) (adenine(37)-N6)-methyltransferase n=1 Tax=Lacimicrobium alkaliphilum TaxID=1526571 RepID=A0A0U3B349_9ALTE|nr:methyltransferase domain-containing protein [Lacimicrobium alkaliphilum]ALS99504.1 hypothetical protein AT746_15385 [Lacimicrobium alkaliphilum]